MSPISEDDTAKSIDWTTVADDDLVPLASDSMEVEIAKIDEQARRQRNRVVARREKEKKDRREKEEEDERRRKEEEEQRRKEEEDARKRWEEEEAEARRLAEAAEKAKAAREVGARAGEDAENEGDQAVAAKTIDRVPSAGVSAPKANRAFVLIPSKSATQHHRVPIVRDRPCTLCITTGEQCIDLPDSRSKQCAKCFRQKKGCRLPVEKTQGKRKAPQLSPRAGEKRKRAKVVSKGHDTRLTSTSMAIEGTSAGAAGSSACVASQLVARVLDRHLGEITSLLRNLVGKADELADSEGKGTSSEVDELAEEEGHGEADEDDEADGDGDDVELSDAMARLARVYWWHYIVKYQKFLAMDMNCESGVGDARSGIGILQEFFSRAQSSHGELGVQDGHGRKRLARVDEWHYILKYKKILAAGLKRESGVRDAHRGERVYFGKIIPRSQIPRGGSGVLDAHRGNGLHWEIFSQSHTSHRRWASRTPVPTEHPIRLFFSRRWWGGNTLNKISTIRKGIEDARSDKGQAVVYFPTSDKFTYHYFRIGLAKSKLSGVRDAHGSRVSLALRKLSHDLTSHAGGSGVQKMGVQDAPHYGMGVIFRRKFPTDNKLALATSTIEHQVLQSVLGS
ncbi:hypothetical protein PISMIDRAFT_25620 [Pisolithus microcarpus 441]|uniref:Uncharacterized protein n=1 Tax=Pisolithus microcarpus 441 TaxID=765257 RepID=A0A0C9YYA8_9AGAM|nr:hypothetical protein BKA83DRAFT_25620 [Pisolithus microcarpus]KIK12888.1 hypothetical protein PISMIDRAFT_25620 [Pisolithus microcarpus 441]